eukprot:GAHX01003343.1.p1 GENE.GAHX01003343.1~~GAHX01003343.1.p1  ORF type:complete len:60 (+),score=6.93 GAHX01003343.1:418-597(+)
MSVSLSLVSVFLFFGLGGVLILFVEGSKSTSVGRMPCLRSSISKGLSLVTIGTSFFGGG